MRRTFGVMIAAALALVSTAQGVPTSDGQRTPAVGAGAAATAGDASAGPALPDDLAHRLLLDGESAATRPTQPEPRRPMATPVPWPAGTWGGLGLLAYLTYRQLRRLRRG